VVPNEIEGFAGVTAIDSSAAAATVKWVEPLIALNVAVMLVVPWLALVANPWLPIVLLIVATPEAEDPQVTEVVKFAV
jgi:hypothetical protein